MEMSFTDDGNRGIIAIAGIVLVIAGLAAVLVKAAYGYGHEQDYFRAFGLLVLLAGLATLVVMAREDGPRDGYFGGCMLAVVGFALLYNEFPEDVVFWLLMIVVAEIGLKVFFDMPSPLRGRFTEVGTAQAVGAVIVVLALVLMLLYRNMGDFFMYLWGIALIALGAVCLAHAKEGLLFE